MFMFCVVALSGLVVGSFLNVVILRYDQKEGLGGRSHCPHCTHTLRWYELVPVVSYVLQKGRCRSCSTALSAQYPFVELSTAVLFVAVWWRVVESFTLETLPLVTLLMFVFTAAVWAVLLVVMVYDFRTTYIPDHFNILFALFALVILFLSGLTTTSYTLPDPMALLAGPILFIPFYLLWKVSDGRWIGLGDGKLAVGMGWFLGLEPGLSAVIFAFWIGALVALLALAAQRIQRNPNSTQGSLGLKSEIPFGPFLVAGTAVVYFTGITFTTLFL